MPLFGKRKTRLAPPPVAPKLHVGAGRARLDGWLNVDMQPLPGVDMVADVTQGLRVTGVESIFAEHFLEHLPVAAAIGFLLEAHRVLVDGGWIRLSTPNLDWVWVTHYRLDLEPPGKRTAAIAMNRAFHGWEHQFLWNRELLGEALAACGFEPVRWCRHGESELPVFRGIERHETYEDSAELPHVVIAEAQRAAPQPERLAELREVLTRDFLSHQKG
jgi:hypothetical protein